MLIPEGTRVPAWAYLDVTVNDTFDPVTAMSVSNPELESTPVSPPSTSTSMSTSITTETSSQTPSNTVVPVPASTHNTVPAIVGGVVGCVLGLGVLSLIAFIFIKRKRNQTGQEKGYGDIPSPTSLPQSATYATWSPPPQFRGEDNNPLTRDALPVARSGSTQ
jgi:hypothetical protein